MATPPPYSGHDNSTTSTSMQQQQQSSVPKSIIPGSSKNNPNLPAIICLHGRGANATIFTIQARRLISGLNDTFRFIFIEAPFESEPGPGVLPVFESVDPFYTWVRRKFVLQSAVADANGRNPGQVGGTAIKMAPGSTEDQTRALNNLVRHGIEMISEDDKEEVAGRINEVVETEVQRGWDGVVGIMGFSQGARLSAGLLLRQLKRQRDGKARPSSSVLLSDPATDKNVDIPSNFKFGIFLGGPTPPILYLDQPIDEFDDSQLLKVKSDLQTDYDLLKKIPTVHAWGRSDPWIEGCERHAELCAGKYSFQMDFEGGHHLPLTDDEGFDLCYFVKRAWVAARDLAG